MVHEYDITYGRFGKDLNTVKRPILQEILEAHAVQVSHTISKQDALRQVERLYGGLLEEAGKWPSEEYLSPTFNIATYNRSALRMVLTMHNIKYIDYPDRADLVELFEHNIEHMRDHFNYRAPLPASQEDELATAFNNVDINSRNQVRMQTPPKVLHPGFGPGAHTPSAFSSGSRSSQPSSLIDRSGDGPALPNFSRLPQRNGWSVPMGDSAFNGAEPHDRQHSHAQGHPLSTRSNSRPFELRPQQQRSPLVFGGGKQTACDDPQFDREVAEPTYYSDAPSFRTHYASQQPQSSARVSANPAPAQNYGNIASTQHYDTSASAQHYGNPTPAQGSSYSTLQPSNAGYADVSSGIGARVSKTEARRLGDLVKTKFANLTPLVQGGFRNAGVAELEQLLAALKSEEQY